MNTALTVADLSTPATEPRIMDLRLAERLGFDRPRNVRKLIERNRDDLARYGEVCSTVEQTSPRGGRPGRAFWLNRMQALRICMLSETKVAADITHEVLMVYDAWQRGELMRALPNRHTAALDMLRGHHEARAERFADRIEQRQAALDEFDRMIDAGARVDDAARAAAELAGVSRATLYNWRLIARGVDGADIPAALTPQYKPTSQRSACHPKALAWLTAEMSRPKRRPPFTVLYRRLVELAESKGWTPIPSEISLRRRMNARATALALPASPNPLLARV